ncbi:hypothetical protein THAOC_13740, partial [Thalassiosira oceanica]
MSANSTVVAAGVSATLQLLRVVADLVTVASRTAKRNEAEIENAKSPPSPDKKGDGGGGGSRRGFSVRNFDGRLSAVSARGFGRGADREDVAHPPPQRPQLARTRDVPSGRVRGRGGRRRRDPPRSQDGGRGGGASALAVPPPRRIRLPRGGDRHVGPAEQRRLHERTLRVGPPGVRQRRGAAGTGHGRSGLPQEEVRVAPEGSPRHVRTDTAPGVRDGRGHAARGDHRPDHVRRRRDARVPVGLRAAGRGGGAGLPAPRGRGEGGQEGQAQQACAPHDTQAVLLAGRHGDVRRDESDTRPDHVAVRRVEQGVQPHESDIAGKGVDGVDEGRVRDGGQIFHLLRHHAVRELDVQGEPESGLPEGVAGGLRAAERGELQ